MVVNQNKKKVEKLGIQGHSLECENTFMAGESRSQTSSIDLVHYGLQSELKQMQVPLVGSS